MGFPMFLFCFSKKIKKQSHYEVGLSSLDVEEKLLELRFYLNLMSEDITSWNISFLDIRSSDCIVLLTSDHQTGLSCWHQVIRLDRLVDIRSSDWIVLLTLGHQTGLSCWHPVIRSLTRSRRRRGGRRRWGSLTWSLERKGSIAVTRHVIYSLFFKLLRAKKVLSMTM